MITTISLSPAVDKIIFIDNFEAGKLFRVQNAIKSAGGKGINVARVASILGEKVAAIGFKAASPEIEVVNTIGSGDSMVAALAAGIHRGGSSEDILRLGMAAAVANTQYQEIGFVTEKKVDEYMNVIKITRII